MRRKIQKQSEEYENLMRLYQVLCDKFNSQYYEKEHFKRQAQRYIRIKARRASDSAIGYRFYFHEEYEMFEECKIRKKFFIDRNFGFGFIPSFERKFHHSNPLHCEKFDLKTDDEINYHQKLFRNMAAQAFTVPNNDSSNEQEKVNIKSLSSISNKVNADDLLIEKESSYLKESSSSIVSADSFKSEPREAINLSDL